MPQPRYAGIVEGFFSAPLPLWTPAERLAILQFVQQHAPQLNAYFYCPKDDPYVTTRWQELYPPAAFAALRALIAACEERGISLIYGFNPELPPAGSARSPWLESVARKAAQLQGAGCARICLLFDDLPLSYDAVEKRIGAADHAAAEFVELAEAAYAALSARGLEVWLCTPDYCFCHQSALTRHLRRLVRAPLIWTGRGVFVPEVGAADLQAARANLGGEARLIYWSNYPVNDVEQSPSVLNLGGFRAPAPEVIAAVEGLFVNPMRQCWANLPFYSSCSRYLADPERYERAGAWQAVLEELLGGALAPLALLIEQFSACSVIDRGAKFMYSRLSGGAPPRAVAAEVRALLALRERERPASEYGARFLKAIERVWLEAARFAAFAERIEAGEAIPAELFLAGEAFPTVLATARNLKEVVEIVTARMRGLPHTPAAAAAALAEAELVRCGFMQRYPGRARLRIPPQDEQRYLRVMAELAALEQQAMLAVLNDAALSPAERLRAYAQRQSINRFTARAAESLSRAAGSAA